MAAADAAAPAALVEEAPQPAELVPKTWRSCRAYVTFNLLDFFLQMCCCAACRFLSMGLFFWKDFEALERFHGQRKMSRLWLGACSTICPELPTKSSKMAAGRAVAL